MPIVATLAIIAIVLGAGVAAANAKKKTSGGPGVASWLAGQTFGMVEAKGDSPLSAAKAWSAKMAQGKPIVKQSGGEGEEGQQTWAVVGPDKKSLQFFFYVWSA
jgi:hypothetical protein